MKVIMKSINRLLAFTLLLSFGISCGDVEELNINPNQPVDVPAANLVTQAQFSIPNLYWGRDMNFEYAMLFVQHIAQDEYTEEQRYSFTAADFDNGWVQIYTRGLYDLQAARGLVEADVNLPEAQRANQIAVIDIMMAFGFQMATDIWGDIPYAQALTGEITQPVYDSQEDIYTSLISSVSNAVGSINTGSAGFSSTEDIIFNGDMDGWQKFGNALLLRMGMRIADANSALASTTVSAALNGNIISSVNEEANLVFMTNENIANPFWFDASAAGGSRDDFRVTAELLGTLQSMNDPRETVYADPTPSGEYVGMPYGLTDNAAFALKGSTSDLGDAVEADPTNPACFLRYSEVKFLHAEAIERGFVSGDAASEFNAGVTAAMNEWGISDAAAIASYLAENPYDAANWDESIGLQMWIALYTNGLEAWATWRRLDQPVLAVPAAAVEPSIPVRGLYPTDEGATNQVNLGNVDYDDALSTRLWWDVN